MKRTPAEIEAIENELMTAEIVKVEPLKWPKTKKEIQETLDHYQQAMQSTKLGGVDIGPEACVDAIQKLEAMLKHAK
jgi:hypothetical protein